MSDNKVELSNETLRRALEAANKEYPDKKDAFGKNQAFYLGVCHEAERSQKLDMEIERLKAENSKMRQALGKIEGMARRFGDSGTDPEKDIEVIEKLATEALKTT